MGDQVFQEERSGREKVGDKATPLQIVLCDHFRLPVDLPSVHVDVGLEEHEDNVDCEDDVHADL